MKFLEAEPKAASILLLIGHEMRQKATHTFRRFDIYLNMYEMSLRLAVQNVSVNITG